MATVAERRKDAEERRRRAQERFNPQRLAPPPGPPGRSLPAALLDAASGGAPGMAVDALAGAIPDTAFDVASGFNRGLAGTVDIFANPIAAGLRGLGVPAQRNPAQGLAERAGLTHRPMTPTAEKVQGVSGALGSAAVPGGLPLALASRGAAMAAPAVRAAAAAPATYLGVEGAGALASGVGAEVGRERGGELGALAGGVLGGLMAPGTAATARAGTRGPRGGDAIAQNAETFRQAGITPEVGQVVQSPPFVAAVSKPIGTTPGGYSVRHEILEGQGEQLGDRLQGISTRARGATDDTAAGMTLQRGIEGFTERFKTRASGLYGKVDEAVGAQHPVALSNLSETVEDIMGRSPETEALRRAVGGKTIQSVADALEGTSDVVPYAAARELRSSIGKKLTGAPLVDDLPRADYKRLYAALSGDLEDAIEDIPGALANQTRADRYYRAGLKRIEQVLQPTVGREATTPEQVFRTVAASVKDPSKLSRVMRSLTKREREGVTGLMMDRMGRGKPSAQTAAGDDYSFETFLTNWNRMPERARRTVFGPRFEKDMGAIARAAELIRKERELLYNPSGTAARLLGGAGVAGMFTGAGVMPLLGGTVGTYAAAKLMNSPAFTKWLAQSTRLPVAQMPAHAQRLQDAALRMDEDQREAVAQYLDALRSSTQ